MRSYNNSPHSEPITVKNRNFAFVNKLHITLKNCYGIKSLDNTFDFEQHNRFAIYAPNGSMKTSFARTMLDYREGNPAQDQRYEDRLSDRKLKDENGIEIPPDNFFVFQNYQDEFEGYEESTLLVANQELSKRYDALIKKVKELENGLVEKIKKQSKVKKDIGEEISSSIMASKYLFIEALYSAKREVERMDDVKQERLLKVPYETVFSDDFLKLLANDNFRANIDDFIKKLSELLNKSNFFKRGIFEYYNATEVTKALKKQNFFTAKNRVVLVGKDKKEQVVETEKDLEGIIQKEKDEIINDPELKKIFGKIADDMEGNVKLRAVQDFFQSNQDLTSLLANPQQFRRDIWISYLKNNIFDYQQLIEENDKVEKEKEDIEAKVGAEVTHWEHVVELFNERFLPPYNVVIENRMKASLSKEPLRFHFDFTDGEDTASVDRENALKTLSTGEKKGLYIMHIIFDIECRKRENKETIFIFDDIADSFDYQNKNAILQYLYDIAETPNFRLIILTHNFDFFRAVHVGGIVNRQHSMMVLNTNNGEISFQESEEVRGNSFNKIWKPGFFTNPKHKIASIPFLRNVIEMTDGKDNDEYIKLTSLLHWRSDTHSISITDLNQIFTDYFKSTAQRDDSSASVIDLITAEADKCLSAGRGINFENKIILSIAIRLCAEKFMTEQQVTSDSGLTTKLTKEYIQKYPQEQEKIKTLRAVTLMTPANIHLNSFMYEPILDMDDQHLRSLYEEVKKL